MAMKFVVFIFVNLFQEHDVNITVIVLRFRLVVKYPKTLRLPINREYNNCNVEIFTFQEHSKIVSQSIIQQ